MSTQLCPHCKKPITAERVGVMLTPTKTRIFDLIQRSRKTGISSYDIAITFGVTAKPVTVKTHIWQINELLAETDWRIISREGKWFLREARRE